MKTGDRVRIEFAGQSCDGVCILASSNGRSLFLAFDRMLGGYMGGMAVLQSEDGEYRDLYTNRTVKVVKVDA